MRSSDRVALAALLGMAATSGQPAPPPGPAGCFEVAVGQWAPRLALGEDTVFMVPPRRIRVGSRPDSTLRSRAYLVTSLPQAAGPVHRRGAWAPFGADSAELVFTTGFSGIVIRLGAVGSAWRGTAHTFWDFPRAEQTAPAALTPISCGAGPRVRKESSGARAG